MSVKTSASEVRGPLWGYKPQEFNTAKFARMLNDSVQSRTAADDVMGALPESMMVGISQDIQTPLAFLVREYPEGRYLLPLFSALHSEVGAKPQLNSTSDKQNRDSAHSTLALLFEADRLLAGGVPLHIGLAGDEIPQW